MKHSTLELLFETFYFLGFLDARGCFRYITGGIVYYTSAKICLKIRSEHSVVILIWSYTLSSFIGSICLWNLQKWHLSTAATSLLKQLLKFEKGNVTVRFTCLRFTQFHPILCFPLCVERLKVYIFVWLQQGKV